MYTYIYIYYVYSVCYIKYICTKSCRRGSRTRKGEEEEENVTIMDNTLYLYIYIYISLCVALYYRRVSVIWRFPRVADKRAPPGPRSTDYTRCAPAMAIMSRYGSAIGARFFIFPLTRRHTAQ